MESSEFLEDLPLPALFGICESCYNALETVHPVNDEVKFDRALAAMQRCRALVDASALFSTNEEQDDLATGDMKYLLVPFYLAETLARSSSADPAARYAAVTQALELHDTYLHRWVVLLLKVRLVFSLYLDALGVAGCCIVTFSAAYATDGTGITA